MVKEILIVDDSNYIRSHIRDALTGAGYHIIGEAANGENAIDMALELEPDLITLDNILPDMTGMDILRFLKEQNLSSRILMISAVGQQSVIEEGMELGAEDYLVKPFTEQELVQAVSKIAL